MNKTEIIKRTAKFVRGKQENDTTGHDWWHTFRVWNLAKKIAKKENADLFIVELAALLHDIADWKFNEGNLSAGSTISTEWLTSLGVEKTIIEQICEIIENVSFKGAKVTSRQKTLEGMVVQDADRLDGVGAIGIARTFAYGGSHVDQPIYDPDRPLKMHKTFEEYKNKKSSSINHFYEKILLLKDLMNTETARKVAEKRNIIIEQYLNQFFIEWEGKDLQNN